ncbi:MAG: D-alanine--D-alanine ligase, partial [Rhodospirillaceae bacterium]|nr:D-alanine--D-alanine ligase [Rhodospirillaceae bacterium]
MTRVAVLMGGFSSEREISLSSGKGCVEGLESAGFDVTPVDVTRNMEALLKALDPAPDVIFNALHGPFGEDGRIQGLLDILEIPYTHSGALASAMAMDKSVSRAIFALQNIPIAKGWVVSSSELDAFIEPPRPYVMKPLCEGSSVGVQIAFETDNKPWEELRREYTKYDRILIERYIPGREIQVAVVGDVALGAIEIRTPRRFYGYRAEYTA